MHNEWQIRWGGLELGRYIGVHGNGVRPPEIRQYMHREVSADEYWVKRIVMTYGCYSAEKVADRAPPEANVFRYRALTLNCRSLVLLNVICPFFVVAIGAVAEIGVKGIFQMVVRVDQAREYQISLKVELVARASSAFGLPIVVIRY